MTTVNAVEEKLVPRSRGHQPVLLDEVVRLLAQRPGATVVDATLGDGGHAEALLRAVGAGGRVVGIERDPRALERVRERLEACGEAFLALHGRHEELPDLLRGAGLFAVDGVLLDLGVSSLQLDDPARGFSFRADGPLDMRMDPSGGATAADLLARESEAGLRRILRGWGEERRAAAIARALVERRRRAPITRTRELAELVERVAGPAARRYRIHPATRTFQALRIAVNGELVGLERLVVDAVSLLRRGGRLVVIAYHSLEDRPVKQALRALADRCTCPPGLAVCGCGRENLIRILTRRPLRPSAAEVERNPRSRSARLRAGERL